MNIITNCNACFSAAGYVQSEETDAVVDLTRQIVYNAGQNAPPIELGSLGSIGGHV